MPWDESRVAGLCLISPSKKSFSRDQELRVRLDRKASSKSRGSDSSWRMFVFRISYLFPTDLPCAKPENEFIYIFVWAIRMTSCFARGFQNIQTLQIGGACVASLSEKTSFASVEATA